MRVKNMMATLPALLLCVAIGCTSKKATTPEGKDKVATALIIAHRLEKQHIRFDAKNGVLTLKGDVDTPSQRAQVEKLAASVPNVQQVVNELDVKGARRKSS